MVAIPPPTQKVSKKEYWEEPWYRAVEEMATGINALETSVTALESSVTALAGFDAAPFLPVYTVGTLPAGVTGSLIYVSDESGGATPAFFDGTDWRRLTDLAIVT